MNTEEAVALRETIRSLRKQAAETDSRSEHTRLTAEAASQLKTLQASCPHEHVVCLWSEYEGSRSYDNEDSHPELRKCLVCEITDTGWDKKHQQNGQGWADFKVLTKEPFARFEMRNNKSEFNREPLAHDLQELIDDCKTRGYPYFGSAWQARQAIESKKREVEEYYQHFKTVYHDRLITDLIAEGAVHT